MVQTKRSKPGEGKGGLPAKVDPLGPTVCSPARIRPATIGSRRRSRRRSARGTSSRRSSCGISWISSGRPCGCGA